MCAALTHVWVLTLKMLARLESSPPVTSTLPSTSREMPAVAVVKLCCCSERSLPGSMLLPFRVRRWKTHSVQHCHISFVLERRSPTVNVNALRLATAMASVQGWQAALTRLHVRARGNVCCKEHCCCWMLSYALPDHAHWDICPRARIKSGGR